MFLEVLLVKLGVNKRRNTVGGFLSPGPPRPPPFTIAGRILVMGLGPRGAEGALGP